MKYLPLIVFFMSTVMLTACGMQGDLYLPEEGTTQNQNKGS